MTQPKPVDFTFARAWIHAGVLYQAGDVGTFPQPTALMLMEAGAGDRARTVKQKRRTASADGTTDHDGD